VSDHRPEVFFVRFHSVYAAIDFGDDSSDQHSLPFADSGGIVHNLTVKVKTMLHRFRSEGLQLGNVRYHTRPLTDSLVHFLQLTRSGIYTDRLHSCHFSTPCNEDLFFLK
jgi:hypothetical protein